jgi:hypothetical protein
MKKSRIFSIVILFILFSFCYLTLAQIEELEEVAKRTELKKESDLPLIVARILRNILRFLGLITVILIIYSGFLWLTSGGDIQKIKRAKGLIINSVVGLLIILFSYVLLSFILTKLITTVK